MLLCTPVTLAAAPSQPTIRLPTDLVTMNAVYGNNSYFDLTLSDIPLGYDIINGTYHGWCVQKTINMTQHVNHTVLLYSCYDPFLPVEYQNNHWDKINYLLNHKQGNPTSIQQAIWYFTNNEDYSSNPDAAAMVCDAEQHGTGFIPGIGELLAVPIEGIPAVQLTFLETTIPAPSALEGLVWNDANANGLQDKGEPGMSDIRVYLYKEDNFLVNTSTTNSQGYYHFTDLTAGPYYLQVTLRTGYHFSPQNVGVNDSMDSDVDIIGKTTVFFITINQALQRWDAGMYRTSSPTPSGSQNHRPTADGTAGEPYNGFIREPLIFDGSRSYDRDGRIITWRWVYGDGTNESGEITTHRYNKTGKYTVTLTVTDNLFATDTYTTTAYITSGNNPPSTPTISGPTFGQAKTNYEYHISATDSDNDALRIIIDWDDKTSDTTTFVPSGQHISMTHLWQTYGFYTIQIYSQDQNNALSEISKLLIAIDVQYIGNLGYLIDTNSDGIFDLFHSNSTSVETAVKILENGDYLIDTDGDSDWDVVFNPTTRQYQDYHAIPILEYLLFILLIIAFLLLYTIIRIKRQTRILHSNRKK